MIDPLDLIEQRLVERVAKVKRRGDKIEACCPAHDDQSPSLGVGRGSTRDIVIKCQAGCSADDVMGALELGWTDLGESRQDDGTVTEYPYFTATGETAYIVVRKPGKKFLQKHRDATGEWVWNMKGVQRVLYRLPEVLQGLRDGKTICVVEGEKDADRLASIGAVATCNSGGADEGNGSKFTSAMADVLMGASVVIIADKDRKGYIHAAHVRRLLVERGCSVRVKEPAIGKDISNHLDAGKGYADLVDIDPDERLQEWVEPAELAPEPDDAWPDPIPLGGGFDALPTFPVEVFPDWIADHVRQVARELQVPVCLPAGLAMVALATCASKRAEVFMTRSWREQLCLYVVVALPPGAGKSPAFNQMLGPLAALETAMVAEALPRIEEARTRRAIVEKAQRKAIEKGETTDALLLGDELMTMKVEAEPRLFVDDVTVEKLGIMLREQGGRLALTSTEGGLFDQMIGRYSDKTKASLDPYLQMWSGDTMRVDRVGRESIVVEKPALTIGVTVQPSVLEALRDRPELKGRGLTARFMYSMPASNVGFRNMLVDADLDERIGDRYADGIKAMWHALAGHVMPLRLEVTPQAKATFMAWRQMLEDERKPGGAMAPLSEWSVKVESSVARTAGLLHLAHGKGGAPIDSADIAAALAVGEYWITHAQAVHEMWGTDETTHVARGIVRWLVESGLNEFSVRDTYNSNRQLMPRADDALEPLALLVERGWIAPLFDGPIGVGKRGKPSPRFAVHPAISSHVRNNHAFMRLMRLETEKRSFSLSPSTDMNTENRPHEAHERMSGYPQVSDTPSAETVNLESQAGF